MQYYQPFLKFDFSQDDLPPCQKTVEGRVAIDELIEELGALQIAHNRTGKKDGFVMKPLRWNTTLNWLIDDDQLLPVTLPGGQSVVNTFIKSKGFVYDKFKMLTIQRGMNPNKLTFEEAIRFLVNDGGYDGRRPYQMKPNIPGQKYKSATVPIRNNKVDR